VCADVDVDGRRERDYSLSQRGGRALLLVGVSTGLHLQATAVAARGGGRQYIGLLLRCVLLASSPARQLSIGGGGVGRFLASPLIASTELRSKHVVHSSALARAIIRTNARRFKLPLVVLMRSRPEIAGATSRTLRAQVGNVASPRNRSARLRADSSAPSRPST
jgi:hypothetical protein